MAVLSSEDQLLLHSVSTGSTTPYHSSCKGISHKGRVSSNERDVSAHDQDQRELSFVSWFHNGGESRYVTIIPGKEESTKVKKQVLINNEGQEERS